MAKIKFERTSAPTGSVEFSRNPSRGNISRTGAYLQPIDYSDGKDLYSYDKGLTEKAEVPMTFGNISSTDLSNFLAFRAVVVGSKYSFTFTDVDGSTSTARFADGGACEYAPVAPGRYSLSFRLLIE